MCEPTAVRRTDEPAPRLRGSVAPNDPPFGGEAGAVAMSPYARCRDAAPGTVRWLPGFWGDRVAQCRDVTLPHLYRLMDDPNQGHALTNLRIAAGQVTGEFAGTHWQDEWVYKWLEAAAYLYELTGDAALDRQMDEIVAIIAAAQQPDGYIATQTIVRGWPRFQKLMHHELYVMGHLMTAACVHHRVTGKTTLLAVASKAADYLYATFMPRDPALAHFGFNPSYVMALVDLYRTVGDRRYLDLATTFIDRRGSEPGGSDVNQDRVPLRDEECVVGHMVLATYLYAGAADVCLETGDHELRAALERLWDDLTSHKLYVHGGVCALHRGLSIRGDTVWEAAGAAYDLPNSTAYNETCAQIGNVLWNWRMLAMTGEARYGDLIERSLYNSVLSGIGLDGASWFYTNVLRWYGPDHPLLSNDAHQRFQPGRNHICCPSNLLRTIAGLHRYVYGLADAALWIHLYGASQFDGRLANGAWVRLTQQTAYPWEGLVRLTIDAVAGPRFALRLRIPEWADGATVTVNGEPCASTVVPGTYCALERDWAAGDVVELTLPLRVRLLVGHPRIEAVRNQVAVMRGPIVYCLESSDLPDGVPVHAVHLPRDIALTPRHVPALLGGVTVLAGDAEHFPANGWGEHLYGEWRPGPRSRLPVTFIPYYAWSNRGVSAMTVWLPLSR